MIMIKMMKMMITKMMTKMTKVMVIMTMILLLMTAVSVQDFFLFFSYMGSGDFDDGIINNTLLEISLISASEKKKKMEDPLFSYQGYQ